MIANSSLPVCFSEFIVGPRFVLVFAMFCSVIYYSPKYEYLEIILTKETVVFSKLTIKEQGLLTENLGFMLTTKFSDLFCQRRLGKSLVTIIASKQSLLFHRIG